MIGPVSIQVVDGQNDEDRMMPPSVEGSMGSAVSVLWCRALVFLFVQIVCGEFSIRK
jgi:hypothetical protein